MCSVLMFSSCCHTMILVAQRVCVSFAAISTGVAPWGGEKVTWSKPGDTSFTKGDGGDLSAHEATKRAMLPGVIRSVNSSWRSESQIATLGELPRQLLPTRSVLIKHIPVQARLSKGTTATGEHEQRPPPARPDLGPTPT